MNKNSPGLPQWLLDKTKGHVNKQKQGPCKFGKVFGKDAGELNECFEKCTQFFACNTYGMTKDEIRAMKHLGCPSYPNCNEGPNGCLVLNGYGGVEWYGHKD